jgi:hypothetical protein
VKEVLQGWVHTRIFHQLYAVAVAYVMYVSVFRMILRGMRMHPNRACIFLKMQTYVEKYAKIRIKYGKNTPKRHRIANIRKNLESKPLFIYAGEKAYAEGLLGYMAYSVCMYIHTPTAYDRTTQP